MKRLISARNPPPLTDSEMLMVLEYMECERQAMPHLRALPCRYDPKKAAAVRRSRPHLRPVRTMAENLAYSRDTLDGILGMLNGE